ncbi:unnamed protein product [Lepidochelys kempii]
MEEAAAEGDPPMADVHLCGHLRKQKSQRRRFFCAAGIQRAGASPPGVLRQREEIQAGGARPKRSFPLASALNINKRAGPPGIGTSSSCTAGTAPSGWRAESPEQQEAWYRAMMDLRAKAWPVAAGERGGRALPGGLAGDPAPQGAGARQESGGRLPAVPGGEHGGAGPAQRPGPLPGASAAERPALRPLGELLLPGGGALGRHGPRELWMQVEDLVVARHIHESILEAMKRLSEDCRVRGRGQASAPVSVPARRLPPAQPPGSGHRRPDGDYTLASSDEGGSSSPGEGRPAGSPEPAGSRRGGRPAASGRRCPLGPGQRRRAEEAGVVPGVRLHGHAARAALPGAGQPGYVPMSPGGVSPPRGEAGRLYAHVPQRELGARVRQHVPTVALGRAAPPRAAAPHPALPAPREAPCPFRSLPRSYKHGAQLAVPGRLSSSSSSSSNESLGEPVPPSPGEYVSIEYPARSGPAGQGGSGQAVLRRVGRPGLGGAGTQLRGPGPGPGGGGAAGGPSPQAYASIDFPPLPGPAGAPRRKGWARVLIPLLSVRPGDFRAPLARDQLPTPELVASGRLLPDTSADDARRFPPDGP